MNEFKSQVKEKIKLYSNDEYLKGYISKEYLTSDKDADIFLYVNDEIPVFDSRTSGNQIDLNKEIYEYIEDKASILENDVRIHFHIMNSNLDDKDQGKVKHIIKEHYAIELYKVQRDFSNARKKAIHLSIFGLFVLLIYFILYNYDLSEFLFEVLSFIFSFSIWEALDAVIYTLSDIRLNRESITQFLLMNVSFDE